MEPINATIPPLAIAVGGFTFCGCGHELHSAYRCEHRDDEGVPCDCDIAHGFSPED